LSSLQACKPRLCQGYQSSQRRLNTRPCPPYHKQNFDADDAFEGGDQPADGIDVLQEEQPQAAAGDRPRITTRYMTKYERARVLGTRALQIR
jgi:hypothetical protein